MDKELKFSYWVCVLLGGDEVGRIERAIGVSKQQNSGDWKIRRHV